MLYCDSLQLNNSCVLHSPSLLLWVHELTRDLSHDLCYKESQDYKGICRVALCTLVIQTDFLDFTRLLNKNEELSSFFLGSQFWWIFLLPLDRHRNKFLTVDIELLPLNYHRIEYGCILFPLFLENLTQTPQEVKTHPENEHLFYSYN